MLLNFEEFYPSIPYILQGCLVTLNFTLFPILFASPFALSLAIMRYSRFKILHLIADTYISIFRGTPLLVQLFLIHFAILPYIFSTSFSPFISGIITFSLNSAAYTSIIIYSGIKSIHTEQWDAAYVLGLSKYNTYRYVIIPQVLRHNLPQLFNEIIDLLKESALISTIGATELFRHAQQVANKQLLVFESYLFVAIVYFTMIKIIEILQKILEKKCLN